VPVVCILECISTLCVISQGNVFVPSMVSSPWRARCPACACATMMQQHVMCLYQYQAGSWCV
jgi:hypothetical protein